MLGASDILCHQKTFTKFLREKKERQAKSANITVVKVLKHFTTKSDSLKRPLLVVDGKPTDFHKPRQQELARKQFPKWTLVFPYLKATSQLILTKDNEVPVEPAQALKAQREVLTHEAAEESPKGCFISGQEANTGI